MPRHPVKYDKELKGTPEWQFLYNKWRQLLKQPHSEDFDNFPAFYEWSLAEGYALGAKLERKDISKPYSFNNCLWVQPAPQQKAYSEEDKAWMESWNKTVNRIRRHFGMKPFPEGE